MLFVVSINKKMRNYFSLIVFFNLAGPFARDQFKYSLLTQVKHVIFMVLYLIWRISHYTPLSLALHSKTCMSVFYFFLSDINN